jgi:hypothetical protein
LIEHEGDNLAAALFAHKIPVTAENIKVLKDIIQLQSLSKSEFNVAALPRKVNPFDQESVPMAQVIQEAFINHAVHEIKLNGKHSNGTALVKDFDTNKIYLLKPGSGALSNALGVKEEAASQSRREVAFNKIAKIMGLGAFVPDAHLLIIDGYEVACLEFFSNKYKTLTDIKNEKSVDLGMVFDKVNQNGFLFKLVALDYLLGQCDRHSGNIMLGLEHMDVKFIDAGSAFAGHSYNPAIDSKSFIPFPLRAYSGRKFNALTPDERFKLMPRQDAIKETAFNYWINYLDEGKIIRLLNLYGINPAPFAERLARIRQHQGPKSEFLIKFFSGVNLY